MESIARRNDVIDRLNICGATLWRWVRDGRFPKPIRLGPNTVGWLNADVDAWIEAKKAAGDQVQ